MQWHQVGRVGLEEVASAAFLPKAFKQSSEEQATVPSRDSVAAGGTTGQSVTPKAGARVQEPRIRAIARSRVWVRDGDGRERKKQKPSSGSIAQSEPSSLAKQVPYNKQMKWRRAQNARFRLQWKLHIIKLGATNYQLYRGNEKVSLWTA